MILPPFPEKCVLLEWQEKGQSFFMNDVIKGKPRMPTNTKGLFVIHICKDEKEAFLLITYLEKYVINKHSKNERVITFTQMNRYLKALLKFSNAHSKLLSKK